MIATMLNEVAILIAKQIRTMDDSQPVAEAVAIRDGWIEQVGSVSELIEQYPTAVIDRSHSDHCLLPGFVEAHSHAMTGGMWEFTYVGFFDRRDPAGNLVTGCQSIAAVLERLSLAHLALDDPATPLIAWGFDPIYFLDETLTAPDLDRVSSVREIFVFHASAHLATINSKLIETANIREACHVEGVVTGPDSQPTGELRELPAMSLAGHVALRILLAAASANSLIRFGAQARNAGITTLTDLGSTGLGDVATVQQLQEVVNGSEFPARLVVFLNPAMIHRTADELGQLRTVLRDQSTDKLRFGPVKLVLDGSIQGFTARLETAQYVGGQPNGQWLLAPEQVQQYLRSFHDAGAIVHAHCNGDQAISLFIDSAEAVFGQHSDERTQHRHTIQHCQLATQEQLDRIATCGLAVNFFSNHLYYWGDQHATLTVGESHAAVMNPAASALARGIPVSIHSDSPITPLGPLHVAWCAVSRQTATGQTLGAQERISIQQALEAITITAAWQLGMDDEIGSIAAGKRADFVVLDRDPLGPAAEDLRTVVVVGTVLGGQYSPACSAAINPGTDHLSGLHD